MKNYIEMATEKFMADKNLKDKEEFNLNCDGYRNTYRFNDKVLEVKTGIGDWINSSGIGDWINSYSDGLFDILSGKYKIQKTSLKFSMSQDEYNYLKIAKHRGLIWIYRPTNIGWCQLAVRQSTITGDGYVTNEPLEYSFNGLFQFLRRGECYKIDDLLAQAEIKEEKTNE